MMEINNFLEIINSYKSKSKYYDKFSKSEDRSKVI